MSKVITLSGLQRMGAANPASANCIAQGGSLVVRKDAGGNEYGVCVFPNGAECEEWAFFRKECDPIGPIGGSCAATGAAEYVYGGTKHCIFPEYRHENGCAADGLVRAVDPADVEKAKTNDHCYLCAEQAAIDAGVVLPAEKTYPKLLNFGIAAGAGALVGLLVAASKSKKFVPRAAGAGVGAALAAIILVMTWPKAKGA